MAHAIGFGEEDVVEHGGGNVFEIVGAIVVGGAVEVGGTDAFHSVDVRDVEILRAGEHEVFEEMSETGLAGFLVFGTDVIPGIDGDDGSFVVFVDENGETVAEDKFGVGDVGDGDGVGLGGVDGGLLFGWGSGGGVGLGEGGKRDEEEGEENGGGRAGGTRREVHSVLPEEMSDVMRCVSGMYFSKRRGGMVNGVGRGRVHRRESGGHGELWTRRWG